MIRLPKEDNDGGSLQCRADLLRKSFYYTEFSKQIIKIYDCEAACVCLCRY